MPKKYIDAEKLICDIDGSECLDTERDYEEVVRRIDECEAADVEEVRHGKWINAHMLDDEWYHTCSNCNTEVVETFFDFYCPVCGAKMDGKAKVGK